MEKAKRKPTTVYLDTRIARAMKVKAALTGETLSDIVNDAVADTLKKDEENIRIVRERRKEPTRPYEEFLKDLKKDGLI